MQKTFGPAAVLEKPQNRSRQPRSKGVREVPLRPRHAQFRIQYTSFVPAAFILEIVMSAILDRIKTSGPKRMLALDGGGTLGVMEIAFLEQIEALLQKRYGKPDMRLCEYFDLIGGTSTGAIIASALALGMSAAEVKELYFRVGPGAFYKPWLSLPGIRPRFSSEGLIGILKEVLGERELQSEDLKTGLAIVAKRIDTGSPWVLTNNPKARYWEDGAPKPGEPGRIGNKRYKLRKVVRASTAAPFYFAPQPIEIHSGEKGLFVDGGVSPHNNPSLQLLMLAGISSYGFNWPVSKEDLLLISIGAGWVRPKITRSWFSAKLAVDALHGLVWDSHLNAMTMLQWMSQPRRRWPINREIGTLAGESLNGALGSGLDLLSFQRYDVAFDSKWIKEETGEDMTAKEVERLNDFMNPGIMSDAYALARKAAVTQVEAADFPERFDIQGRAC